MIALKEYFVWKELVVVDGEAKLITPWADPSLYEELFDYECGSIDEAYEVLKDFGGEEEARESGWVLCKVVVTPLEQLSKEVSNDNS